MNTIDLCLLGFGIFLGLWVLFGISFQCYKLVTRHPHLLDREDDYIIMDKIILSSFILSLVCSFIYYLLELIYY